MATVAVPGFLGVIKQKLTAHVSGPNRQETHVSGVNKVIAAVKRARPLLNQRKEVANCGHRTVVEIRSAQPDSVQRFASRFHTVAGTAALGEDRLASGGE